MRKWKKHLLSVVASITLLAGLVYSPASAEPKEGASLDQWVCGYLFQYQIQLITTDLQKQKPKSNKTTPKKKKPPKKELATPHKPSKPKQQQPPTSKVKPEQPKPKPAQPKQPVYSDDLLPIEQEVVRLVNDERVQRGLKPLQMDAALSSVARDKSKDMRDRNYFSHTSPTYGSPFDMMKTYGISYRAAGENIAAGQTTAEQVVKGWMNSKGHRENILSPQYTTIGVGYAKGGAYGHYWTQMFISR